MNSFISWEGGKRILAQQLVAMMPEHKCYVEVFGGGGWVLFRKDPSKAEVYNDLNSDLVNLYKVVRNDLDRFKGRQFYLLSSREEYKRFMADIRTREFQDDVDRAIAFYYCLRNSFGGKVFGGYGYGTTQRSKYRAGLKRLDEAHERLQHVYIEHLSFERLIPNYDRPHTLFYCDPPYAMEMARPGGALYQHSFTEEDHVRLRDILKGIKGKFILSYDDHPFVRKLYKARCFRIHQVDRVLRSLNQRPGREAKFGAELVITNYKVPKASKTAA